LEKLPGKARLRRIAGAFGGGALDGGALDGGALDGGAFDGGVFDGSVLDGGALDGGVRSCPRWAGGGPLPARAAGWGGA
jgi:hypothetical protein